MSKLPTNRLGKSSATVTQLGFGSAPLGELFERVSNERAQATLDAAWEGGIRYYDTAPFYGYGKSEHRVGRMLQDRARGDFHISTKVGRVLTPTADLENFDGGFWTGGLPFDHVHDYSYDGIMRSYEDSLQRLGLNSVDLLLIHDLDFWFHKTEECVTAYLNQLFTSGWKALEKLRSSGQIKGVGAGINEMGMIPRFLDMVDLDFFIVAMPYNLLDQDALDGELQLVEERGLGIVVGAVFASGILATGPIEGSYYKYEPATAEILDRTGKIQSVCERHGVPLGAAALQFPLYHPAVHAVIPGALNPEQVTANIKRFTQQIPNDVWSELKSEGLLRDDAPTP